MVDAPLPVMVRFPAILIVTAYCSGQLVTVRRQDDRIIPRQSVCLLNRCAKSADAVSGLPLAHPIAGVGVRPKIDPGVNRKDRRLRRG